MTAEDTLRVQMAVLRRRFRDQGKARSERLAAACQRSDIEDIREVAHIIAGSAGLFGFPELAAQASDVSDRCRGGNSDEILAAARALGVALADVSDEED
ncbi:Hpt domain-containing protein [Sphingomonas sinipercae]|uniref:Hpt domain-containing protein n=1 Tax=Sphingomonas sinipercae TaxID=2714944 RepID=A0A6G7ZK47_9SPHN|nr:Hpt domain-containing protein [Sphingomonas sinipercae]QIL01367.1 Hpt domain-containing protein [Sphingomonas sinipercae]